MCELIGPLIQLLITYGVRAELQCYRIGSTLSLDFEQFLNTYLIRKRRSRIVPFDQWAAAGIDCGHADWRRQTNKFFLRYVRQRNFAFVGLGDGMLD